MTAAAVFLLGPTASGKTATALALAEQFPVEIISVDSALVYRDMNIGTAKPDAATLARYPHHLIDLIDPTQVYSAAQFSQDALALVRAIHQRGRVPLFVGGTMLYVKALREGLSALPVADAALRQALAARAEIEGWPALHRELATVDPATAARLAPHDAQRIARALEVFQLTGVAMSRLHAEAAKSAAFPFPALLLGLVPTDRAHLHARIAARFDTMLALGLIDELKTLRTRYPLHENLPAMRCVGYRQAWDFLQGRIDAPTLREQGIAATRQLAKRQLTWLRSTTELQLLDGLTANVARDVAARVTRFLDTA